VPKGRGFKDHEKLYARTVEHVRRMTSLGEEGSDFGKFHFVSIWQCEYTKLRLQDAEFGSWIKEFEELYDSVPLYLREGLKGGHVESVIHDIIRLRRGYTLRLLDFVSLYPSIMYGVNGEVFPVGHPQIFLGKEIDLYHPDPMQWFGMCKVTVLAPTDLYFPVLPVNIKGRLVFPLCYTCAMTCQASYCKHSEKQRMIRGVYWSAELQMALSKGYTILSKDELWFWPPSQRSKSLFQDFIRDLYKGKALASGAPSDPVKLQKLIDEYAATMSLHLSPDEFKKDPTARALCKFSLNNACLSFSS